MSPLNTLSLDYEHIDLAEDFPTLITEFETLDEQRRNFPEREMRSYKLTHTALNDAAAEAWRTFYKQQQGALTKFLFEDPWEEVDWECRFVPGTFKMSKRAGLSAISVSIKGLNEA